jgi:hypothetical protein
MCLKKYGICIVVILSPL